MPKNWQQIRKISLRKALTFSGKTSPKGCAKGQTGSLLIGSCLAAATFISSLRVARPGCHKSPRSRAEKHQSYSASKGIHDGCEVRQQPHPAHYICKFPMHSGIRMVPFNTTGPFYSWHASQLVVATCESRGLLLCRFSSGWRPCRHESVNRLA